MEWAKRTFHSENLLSAEVPVCRTDCVGSRVGLSRPSMHRVENIRDKDEATVEEYNKRAFSDAFWKGQERSGRGGLQADQTEETLPGWAGMPERKGGHSSGIKNNKRSFCLKYTLLGCLLSRFWQFMHSPSTQNCHFLKFSGTLGYSRDCQASHFNQLKLVLFLTLLTVREV